MAQSNATGVIFGHVATPAGATVTLVNTDTGLKRTVAVDDTGTYRVTSLPAGHYKVELTRNGAVAGTNEVDVIVGQGVNASFENVATVQVTGRRTRIDVSNATNGAIFTAKELAKLPVQPTLNSIVLLAPNTTKGDAAYGSTSSFGGSAVSENSFYLNGFPITNPLSQLGSMELPFGAIQQASVLTGGFGAEFGRSIGGVLSVTTKSGTNNWEAGASYSIEPNGLRAKQHNIYYQDTGVDDNKDTNGKMDLRRDTRSLATSQYGAYVGGPIIQDKLFMFISADQTVTKDAYVGATTQTNVATIGQNGWTSNRSLENRWVGKLDWNINDSNRLEFTSAGDDNRTRYQKYGYALNPNNPNARDTLDGTPTGDLYTSASAHNLGPTDPEYPGAQGAKVNMLKYTGNINDDLTVTALYGEMKTDRGVSYEQLGNYQSPLLPPTITTGVTADHWPHLASGLYRNFNPFPGYISKPGEDKVKSARIDLEWKLGRHTLRAGIDEAKLTSSTAGQVLSGNERWIYHHVSDDPTIEQFVSYSRKAVLANYGLSGTDGFYVTHLIFNSVTGASSKQSAQYIEDRFQATNNLLLTFGLRNDAYSNSNGDGQKFIEMKHQIAPRFQAAWDVHGDSSLKIFGSAGRYYLQLPTQVAARAASRSTFTEQDFTYADIDPSTGVPTGLNQINTALSVDGEYGQAKNPRSVVAEGLKPNYQDELTLGFEKALTPDYTFGAKVTYRKLGAGIDDSCDLRPMYDFALKNGIDVQNPGAMNCFIYNPGRDVTVWIDGNDADGNPVVTGHGQMAHFTAAEIGEPEAKRTYAALDMFLEHPLHNGWFGRVNYTLSRNSGNMEGQTRSDTGQTDVGTSAAWDFPEFAPGSDGLLPNDRKHQIKLFGYYQLTSEWSVGGNALIQSGRPRLCLGTNPTSDGGTNPDYPMGSAYWAPGYGAEYFYCDSKPSPRGSLGRLPWETRLDLNLTYSPAMVKGLSLTMDVFNVLNSQKPLTQDPTYDTSLVIEPTYNEFTAYQTPRSVRFTAQFNHKF